MAPAQERHAGIVKRRWNREAKVMCCKVVRGAGFGNVYDLYELSLPPLAPDRWIVGARRCTRMGKYKLLLILAGERWRDTLHQGAVVYCGKPCARSDSGQVFRSAHPKAHP